MRGSYDPSYDYHADPIAILYVRSELRLVVDLQTALANVDAILGTGKEHERAKQGKRSKGMEL